MAGSPVYENWQTHRSGETSGTLFEFPLYSDSDGIPEMRSHLGPYQVLRSLREVPVLQDCPALILRITSHVWTEHGQTGSSIPDEFASLLSLLSGTRLAAGGNYTRRWGFNDDPLGQPIYTHDTLIVPKSPLLMSYSVLPQLSKRRGLDQSLLRGFPDLSASQSLVVTKAARLYQTALWYAETQQEYSWLMLVSAIETAAAFWQRHRLSPEEQLGELRPTLRDLLLSAGGKELLEAAAAELADYMGATRKFVSFVTNFAPEHIAGMEQPERALREIYAARSKALHSGVAIPRKLPLTLEGFEQVTRDSLIHWWKSLGSAEARKAD
jgi:hypothetical protein